MDNILGIAGSGCSTVGVGASSTAASTPFDPNVWVLLVIPVLFFVLTFIFKGNVIMGVITIITSSVMIYNIVYNYDNIYAVLLFPIIIGACIKMVKESVAKGVVV